MDNNWVIPDFLFIRNVSYLLSTISKTNAVYETIKRIGFCIFTQKMRNIL